MSGSSVPGLGPILGFFAKSFEADLRAGRETGTSRTSQTPASGAELVSTLGAFLLLFEALGCGGLVETVETTETYMHFSSCCVYPEGVVGRGAVC